MDCYTVMCMVSMYIIGHVTSLQHVVAEGFLNPFNHAGCTHTYCLKQVFVNHGRIEQRPVVIMYEVM